MKGIVRTYKKNGVFHGISYQTTGDGIEPVNASKSIPIARVKVAVAQWMVISRHNGMMGGVSGHGYGLIEEYFNNYKDADAYARKISESIRDTNNPHVWVTKCDTVYINAAELKEYDDGTIGI